MEFPPPSQTDARHLLGIFQSTPVARSGCSAAKMLRHPQNRIKSPTPGGLCRSLLRAGGAHPGGQMLQRAGPHQCRGMLLPPGQKATGMQGAAASLAPPLVPGPGRQGEAGGEKCCSLGARSPPTHPSRPLSEHWGIISPFNHKKQICACHQRAARMETAAQTSMGHTRTERRREKKNKSCRNPNPAISSLFISSLYGAPQGKCYQTVSEHLIQQRPSFGKRTKEKQNKR